MNTDYFIPVPKTAEPDSHTRSGYWCWRDEAGVWHVFGKPVFEFEPLPDKVYHVLLMRVDGGSFDYAARCTCPDFKYQQRACKHILLAVSLLEGKSDG